MLVLLGDVVAAALLLFSEVEDALAFASEEPALLAVELVEDSDEDADEDSDELEDEALPSEESLDPLSSFFVDE